jgi:hypothetical protein
VDFCAAFELSLEIRVKLADINSYTGAWTVRRFVVSELKEIGFKNGEIAAMKDAVAPWTTTINKSTPTEAGSLSEIVSREA